MLSPHGASLPQRRTTDRAAQKRSARSAPHFITCCVKHGSQRSDVAAQFAHTCSGPSCCYRNGMYLPRPHCHMRSQIDCLRSMRFVSLTHGQDVHLGACGADQRHTFRGTVTLMCCVACYARVIPARPPARWRGRCAGLAASGLGVVPSLIRHRPNGIRPYWLPRKRRLVQPRGSPT